MPLAGALQHGLSDPKEGGEPDLGVVTRCCGGSGHVLDLPVRIARTPNMAGCDASTRRLILSSHVERITCIDS